ncbi:MAG TPA: hypothetical protein DCW29_00785 [Janthinobacterium sp.]|nr:hypothetical protein [Janthinobacterium sp.]
MSGAPTMARWRARVDWRMCGVALLVGALGLGAAAMVAQFGQWYPSGIYRDAARIFMCGVLLVWLLMAVKPSAALALLFVMLPIGARLAEYFKFDLDVLMITVDVVAIWGAALISFSLRGLRRDEMHLCFLLFVGVAAFSSLYNGAVAGAGIIVNGVLTQFLMYALVCSHLRDVAAVKRLLSVLAFVVVFCALFGFVQPVINHDPLEDFFYMRIPSVFYNPIIFANVIILLWPFLLVFEIFPPGRRRRLTYALRAGGLVAALGALLLTGSRGGCVICALQIVWLLTKFKKINRVSPRGMRFGLYGCLGLAALLAAMNVDFLLETVLRRFAQIDFSAQGNSASERVLGALGGIELGLKNPIFGVGLGNFKFAYPHTAAALRGSLELESAHNFILNLFAEVGGLAALLWLAITGMVFHRLEKLQKWLCDGGEPTLYFVLKSGLWGGTATLFLFYGEFLHKNVGLPMIFYFSVLGVVSALYFIKRIDQNHV